MYVPVQFREHDRDNVVDFVRAHPFGLIVTAARQIEATPIPFVVHVDADDVTLSGHIARANGQWKDMSREPEVLLIYQGANNYVTPNWYPTKQTTHEHVPTWNYDMVQIRGQARVIEDREWLLNNVTELTQVFEGARDVPWRVEDAPAGYLDTMLKSIVGFEVRVTEMVGKWKMNQNRLPEDVEGAWRGLSDPADPHHNAQVAARVHELNHDRFPDAH